MKKRNILYIAISAICVIAIIVGVYAQVFGDKPKQNTIKNEVINTGDDDTATDPEVLKQEFNSLFNNSFDDQGYDKTSIKKLAGYEDQDVIYAVYRIKEEKDEKYSVNINIPVFNVDGEVASEFNATTQSIFANKAGNVLSNSQSYTIYDVEYVGYLNENVLSLVIKSTLKEGNNPQRIIVQTYNYDITTGKKLTLNEVLEAKGISEKEVNKKIELQVTEANKNAEALSEALASAGQTVYKRDVNNKMYLVENINQFYISSNCIYVIFAYGNDARTSEMDIVTIN